jgi:predicted ATPase
MRLQALAAPGTILVSDTTLRLLRGVIRSEAAGLVRVPGHVDPLMAYTVLGMETLEATRVRSPFVGRQRELLALDDLLTRALEGQGQVVGIVGEPGMGKSRLLAEFQERLQHRAVTVLEGYCQAYTQFVPYAPVSSLLCSACGLGATAAPDVVARMLTQTLQAVGLSVEDSLPYLLQLLVGQTTVAPLAQLTPEAIKERTFATLCQFHLRSSQQRPLLLVVENLHWIDPTSEAYLAALVDQLAGASLLLLTTYRPGYRPPWMDKSYATQLTLPRLTQEESVAVVRAILPAAPHSDALVAQIVARAEGNPLFLEELAHAMREQDTLATGSPVPETIQAVLAARIEQLPEVPRRVLRTAAVLGREVPFDPLSAVWEEAGDLAPHLHELMRLELLYARPGMAEPVYVFKHVLTQEVAYEGLLLAQRQVLHAAVGQALEARHAGRLDEVVDLLAYHYARTDNAARAVEYLTQVAARAARGHAYAEALAALQEAMPHAERLPIEVRDRRCIELTLRQALSLRTLGRLREGLSLLQREQPRLERLHEPTLTGPYYFQLGYMSTNLALYAQANEHLQQALTIAAQCNDTATMGKAHYALAGAAIQTGHYTQGVAHGQQAITLLEQTPERYWLGLAFYILGSSYWYLGELALALAHAGQNPTAVATALRMLGRIALARGALTEAETHFQEVLQLHTTTERRSRVGDLALDLARLAHAQGNPQAVATHLHEALTLFSALRLPRWVEYTTQLASELGVSFTPS